MKLLIVESKGKIEKLQSILGPEWKVAACFGHVRDLPPKALGFSESDFEPDYEETERGAGIIGRLKTLVKSASEVYLASDPDREGEAIAWHLWQCLKLKDYKRITFAEITESAVKAAIAAPRKIDMAQVDAQKARRVLDRAYGWLTSGPLSRACGCKSAGRVQTPGVCLIVERERARTEFTTTTHYGVELSFEAVDNVADGWKAQWISKDWIPDGQEYLLDKDVAAKVEALRTLEILDCQQSEARKAPPAPFSTSALQQTAKKALGFAPKKTMQLAQGLYESGAITYMRTDSVNLSAEAQESIRRFCIERQWPVLATPRTWKAKGNAQEAHECVRPTHIEIESAGETEDHKKLYALIRLRALATQLEDTVYAVTVLKLGADVDGKQALFEARGRSVVSPGWRVVYDGSGAVADDGDAEGGDGQEPASPVPAMKVGSKATAVAARLLTKNTKPPTRYDEASLVRELEKRGIGRPSTYVSIIETIKDRGYVALEKDQFVPTPLGYTLYDAVKGRFAFVEYETTQNLESALDGIVEGKTSYNAVVAPAYSALAAEVDGFTKATGKVCPECGKAMRHIVKPAKGKNKGYDFWGCTGFPDCKHTM